MSKPKQVGFTAKALQDIADERARQVNDEGYTRQHDDEHYDGSMAMAAACYAAPHRIYVKHDYVDGVTFSDPWPQGWRGDKRPHEGNMVRSNASQGEAKRRDLLVKAAALIVAEIERIDRAEAKR
jgi:hypothetical protein